MSPVVKGFGCRRWRTSLQGGGPAFESRQGRNPRWEFREGRGVLYGDLGIKDGNGRGRREGREQGSTALVSVTVRRGGQQPRRRVAIRAWMPRARSILSAPRRCRSRTGGSK